MKATKVLYNAKVVTMDKRRSVAQAVALYKDRILAVGSSEDMLALGSPGTQTVDLGGLTVVPGFVDCHVHPILWAGSLMELDLRGEVAGTIEDVLQRIRECAGKLQPGEWVRAQGIDDSKLKERRLPTREELDAAAPENPVYLYRICGHVAMVNSRALMLARISADTPNPDGGTILRDPATGEPTGLLAGTAKEFIPKPSYTPEQYKKAFLKVQAECARLGVTAISDMVCQPRDMHIYLQCQREQNLRLHVDCWPTARPEQCFAPLLDNYLQAGIESGLGNDLVRIGGMKFLLDGSTGARTAAYAAPYEGESDNYGLLYMKQEDLDRDVGRALAGGLRIAAHAIGERSIELLLRAVEKAADTVDVIGMRNRVEHCVLPTADQRARIRALGMIPSLSTGFIYSLGDSYYRNLGSRRAARAFPVRTFMDEGVICSGNSDCPSAPVNPWLGIYGVVTRTSQGGCHLGTEEETVGIIDALALYTINGAYAMMLEESIGSIEPGKFADLAVISADLWQMKPEKIKDINNVMTIFKGEQVYSELSAG